MNPLRSLSSINLNNQPMNVNLTDSEELERELSKLTQEVPDMKRKSIPAAVSKQKKSKKFRYEDTLPSEETSLVQDVSGVNDYISADGIVGGGLDSRQLKKKEFLEDFYDDEDQYIDRNKLKKGKKPSKGLKRKKARKESNILG